jgi:hypothetical protein
MIQFDENKSEITSSTYNCTSQIIHSFHRKKWTIVERTNMMCHLVVRRVVESSCMFWSNSQQPLLFTQFGGQSNNCTSSTTWHYYSIEIIFQSHHHPLSRWSYNEFYQHSQQIYFKQNNQFIFWNWSVLIEIMISATFQTNLIFVI